MIIDQERSSIGRRTIVKGAAWSVPVVAAAITVPQASASPTRGCTNVTRSFDAGDVTTVTVPAGVTSVTYTVRGAGGGGGTRAGFGDLTSGTIFLAGPVTFRVVVGEGGTAAGNGQGTGGTGYGRGGNSTNRQHSGPNNLQFSPGGGGGGTALLIGSTPLIVAGGGGGNYLSQEVEDVTEAVRSLNETFQGIPFGTADAQQNGHAGGMGAVGGSVGFCVNASRRGSGSSGGAGGGSSHWRTDANNNWGPIERTQGGGGGDYGSGANGGGNGGNGSARLLPIANGDPRAGSGGGGGGYAGGGGGGLAASAFKEGVKRTISAGGGAGGASYLISTAAASNLGLSISGTEFAPARIAPNNNGKGHPGLVSLSWCEPR